MITERIAVHIRKAGYKRPCSRSRLHSLGILAALLFEMIVLTGCLSRPSLVKQSFNLSYPAAPPTVTSTTRRVLGIKRLTIATQFDDQSLVYRTGELSYERDPYSEFLVPPSEAFAIAIRGYFRESGLFSNVADPGSASRPDLLVEIFIDQLYGDFRNRAASSAVLVMRFIFFDATSSTSGKVMAQKDCTRQVRVKARTAAALMEGWNDALKQVLGEVCSDLKSNGVAGRSTLTRTAEP